MAWLPEGLSVFSWCLHSISTHEITFTGQDTANGRVHLFNRNGLVWEGNDEVLDVGGHYVDEYVRDGDRWRIRHREERTVYMVGGEFAAMLNKMVARQG